MEETQVGKSQVSLPIHLKFENLTVKIKGKYILQNVSGEVKPGEVLALMGPSGAGKTTLLNMLFGRFNGMDIESGKIKINNQVANKRLRRQIGYVVQEDIFLSHLTVQQTLDFVGELSLPESLPKEKKTEVVNNVIDQLSLKKCVSTAMGGGMFSAGCSGGEKKRCSIAIEMIKNPGMLILDEPTSGLDAAISANLVRSVKSLAENQGRSIITSIHQPSSHVFHMFDKLLLLCNGRVAYFGSTGEVLSFFESMSMPCYPNWNPADFILEKLTDGPEVETQIVDKYDEMRKIMDATKDDEPPTKSDSIEIKINDDEESNDESQIEKSDDHNTNGFVVVDTEKESSTFASVNLAFSEDNINEIENNKVNGSSKCNSEKCPKPRRPPPPVSSSKEDINTNKEVDEKVPKWPTGLKTQVVALSKRSFIQTRKIILDKFGFGQAIGVAIASSLIWFNMPQDELSITDRNGVCFFVMVYLIFNPMFFSLLSFPPERDTITKERAAGMYRLSSYFIAKNISEFPVLIVQPLMIYSLIYWGTGLNRSPVFLIGLLTVITVCILSQSIGYCFGSLIKNLRKCISICVVFALSCMLLGGFYVRRMPKWLSWAKYLSHISHAYNIQHRLEFTFGERKFKCNSDNSLFDACKVNGTGWIAGDEIQEKYATLEVGVGESFAILWLYILISRVLFYIFLRYFNRPK